MSRERAGAASCVGLADSFPQLTTKKLHTKSILYGCSP